MNPREALAAKAALSVAAQTLADDCLPELGDDARGRVSHVLLILARVAAALEPADDEEGEPVESEGRRRQADDERGRRLVEAFGSVRPNDNARRIDAQALQRSLRESAQGGPDLRVTAMRVLPGGRSKQTILVTQEGARELPHELVVRQDWAGSVVGTTVAGEYEVLSRLWLAGVRVPRPLLAQPGSAGVAPFVVVERCAGRSRSHQFAAPAAAACALQLADQLGRVHALDPAKFEGLPGLADRASDADALRARLAGFGAVIDKLQQLPSALVAASLARLDRTAHRVRGPRTLVHGDVSFHNCLCEGETLTAVLDWELTHFGNPALDLGYLRVAVEQAVDWEAFLRRYRQAGGPALDAFTVDWYSLYGIVWFHHMVLQAQAGLIAGVVRDIEVASVCADVGPQALARMAEALARLGAVA